MRGLDVPDQPLRVADHGAHDPNLQSASSTLPDTVAAPFRRVLLSMKDAGELGAAKDPRPCAFDFSALVPIPDDVRRKDWRAAGCAWCVKNWGVAYQPANVECKAGERRIYNETKAENAADGPL